MMILIAMILYTCEPCTLSVTKNSPMWVKIVLNNFHRSILVNQNVHLYMYEDSCVHVLYNQYIATVKG